MDRNSWMYGIRRDTIEYLTGLEEFMKCAEEDMRRRDDRTILCPCRDCQNCRRFRNVEDVRDHLIRRGFKERYNPWVWHGERSIHAGTSRTVPDSETFLDPGTDVPAEMGGENVENLDSTQCMEQFDELDEMMHDVGADFVDNQKVSSNFLRARGKKRWWGWVWRWWGGKWKEG